MDVTTVGVDLAKHVFQIHGVSQRGTVSVRKQLKRTQVEQFFATLPPCLVGMEACASAHHWGPADPVIRPHGQAHGPSVCEAIRQEQQKRRG